MVAKAHAHSSVANTSLVPSHCGMCVETKAKDLPVMYPTSPLSYAADAADYQLVYADICERGIVDFERSNAAVQCCDRHPGDALALNCVSQDGEIVRYTFSQLQQLSCRFANLLVKCGVRSGDPVAVLLPRSAELVIAFLGVLRMGATYQPLFTAFGPKAVNQRIRGSAAKVVITDSANRLKIEGVDGIDGVICVGAGQDDDIPFHAFEDEPATFSAAASQGRPPIRPDRYSN